MEVQARVVPRSVRAMSISPSGAISRAPTNCGASAKTLAAVQADLEMKRKTQSDLNRQISGTRKQVEQATAAVETVLAKTTSDLRKLVVAEQAPTAGRCRGGDKSSIEEGQRGWYPARGASAPAVARCRGRRRGGDEPDRGPLPVGRHVTRDGLRLFGPHSLGVGAAPGVPVSRITPWRSGTRCRT